MADKPQTTCKITGEKTETYEHDMLCSCADKPGLDEVVSSLNNLIPMPDPNLISYNYFDVFNHREKIIRNFAETIIRLAGEKHE